MNTELESLQNAANDLGLIIYEYIIQDKRVKTKMYFAQLGKETVSPVLNYENLNHFLLGWHKALKHNKYKDVLNELHNRIDSSWELFCSGTQHGLKNALLKESKEILNK